MAGDWIKMRPSLLTSPKVNGIARIIEDDSNVGRILSTGFNGRMSEIVTRNVMRNVTVASLLTVWGAANEHTTDGIFKNADLSDIDDMVGIPGFGDAMASVGWAIFDDKEYSVILPNFNEYNTCGKDRAAEKNAERQRKHREKLKQDSNVTNNVTVTLQSNVEKRREEKIDNIDTNVSIVGKENPDNKTPTCPHQEIIALYAEILPSGIQPRVWEGARASALKTRWRENAKRQNMDYWRKLFSYIAESPFLMGKVSDANRRPFEISLDWIVKAENFAKIIEGKYHGKTAA